MAKVEKKLEEMGVQLKELAPSIYPILRTRQSGNMLYVSGHPSDILGKLGDNLTVAEGYQGARQAAINCLSAVKGAIGDLDRIKQFVKLLGMVNCTPDFIDQPYVINGATDLLTEAFGKDVGAHARSAVGMVSLPRGIAVELEMIIELKEE